MGVEKVTQVSQTKPWCEQLGFAGDLLYGQYTYGIAGERFFREISGLVHRLGEVEPEEVEIGMPVEIVLKPKEERIGSILDIKYFKPA